MRKPLKRFTPAEIQRVKRYYGRFVMNQSSGYRLKDLAHDMNRNYFSILQLARSLGIHKRKNRLGPGDALYRVSAGGHWVYIGVQKNGQYGSRNGAKIRAKIDGKYGSVVNLLYEKEIGPIPRNRELGACRENDRCVNPHHSTLMTPAERARTTSLTRLAAADAVRIKKLCAKGRSQKSVADEYGIR